MLLANPADVISQLGFDTMTDITLATSMAMDAAEAYLSSQLNTDFLAGTFIDTFYVRQPRYQDGAATSTEFRLSHGLVSSVTSATTTATPADFWWTAAPADVTADIVLDGDRGIAKDITNRYFRQTVTITYVSGFAVDPDTPNSYLISSVPDWLQNACKLKTLVGLVDSPVLSEAQIKLDSKLLNLQLGQLLSRKLRYAPLAILPL